MSRSIQLGLACFCSLLLVAPTLAGTVEEYEYEKATVKAYCSASSVQIGEPFTLSLDILHPSALRILLDAPEEGAEHIFGDRWVVVEPRRVVRLPLGDGSGNSLTQVRWRLFCVEPGEFEVPTIGADCVASGAAQRLPAPMALLTVLGELGPDEDQARAPQGFREAPEVEPPALVGWLRGLALGAGGLLLLAVVLWLRRRKPKQTVVSEPTPLELLQAIDSDGEEESLQDAYFVLSRAVRSALDARVGEDLPGLSDEEWLAHRRENTQLPAALLDSVAELLNHCELVKYGAATPTHWALAEALELAKSLCTGAPLELAVSTEVGS